MDALSEILRVIKLDSAIYLNAEFSGLWCLASPEARTLAPMLAQGAEHVIIYALLCEGRAGQEPTRQGGPARFGKRARTRRLPGRA
jgi:hypothetical protein